MKKQYAVIYLFLAAAMLLSCNDVLAREVKVAVFQFDVHSKEDLTYIGSGISALVPSRITVPGKISVIDNYLIKKELIKEPEEYSLAEKLSIAKKLGADFFLTGSITKTGNSISVDSLLVDVLDSEQDFPVFIKSIGLDNIIPEINNFARKVKKIIIEGPPISEHITSHESPASTEKTEGAKSLISSPEISSESVPEGQEKQPVIKEAPLYDTVE
jgi:TolB-like protein